jgi:mycothiol synthase
MTDFPYTIRNYQPADFEKYVLLSREAAKVEPFRRPVSSRSIAEWLVWPDFSPERDLFVVEIENAIVGYLDIRAELGIGRAVLYGWLQPEHRRKGIATKLLDYAMRRVRELGAKTASADINEDDQVARTVLIKLGFKCVHHSLELKLDMARIDREEAKQAARGCRHLQTGDEAGLTEIQNRSFAEHWGYNPNTPEAITFLLNLSHRSPDDVILMCRDDRIIGYCWTEIITEGEGRISMLGSDPDHRGKGIGKKLLMAGLAYLKDKGASTVILNVDSENKAARNLYKSIGFKRSKTILSYDKAVD